MVATSRPDFLLPLHFVERRLCELPWAPKSNNHDEIIILGTFTGSYEYRQGSNGCWMAIKKYIPGINRSICAYKQLNLGTMRPLNERLLWRKLERNNQQLELHSEYGIWCGKKIFYNMKFEVPDFEKYRSGYLQSQSRSPTTLVLARLTMGTGQTTWISWMTTLELLQTLKHCQKHFMIETWWVAICCPFIRINSSL